MSFNPILNLITCHGRHTFIIEKAQNVSIYVLSVSFPYEGRYKCRTPKVNGSDFKAQFSYIFDKCNASINLLQLS